MSRQWKYCEHEAPFKKHNVVEENLLQTLEVEVIWDVRYKTHKKLKQTVFEYIEIDYN